MTIASRPRLLRGLRLLPILSLVFAAPALWPAHAADEPAVQPAPPPAAVPIDPAPWIYAGSDIPRDAGWQFGTLPNGLRFAVRNNGVPPGQVAIRVRIDAGSLVEEDSERGFAHLLEHLSFRGSIYMADGDAKRVWQRFGATFGSDNNAETTPTHTAYKLDLPNISGANLDEAMQYLSGMIRAPRITDTTLAAERGVVLAELRESSGPQARVGEAINEHLFSGQRLSVRAPIGTIATLDGARAAAVQAFHDRWYRPENTVVIISGDGSPDNFAALVARHFGDWTGKGTAATAPDFGKPDAAAGRARTVVEPGQPLVMTLARLRPYQSRIDTIANTEQLYLDFIATSLINRRLETRARSGGSFLVASAQQEDVSRSADVTTLTIIPAGDDWAAALRDVRGVIGDAVARKPSQADIDRELNEMEAFLLKELQNAQNEPGARLADDFVQSVDRHEVVTTPAGQVSMFAGVRKIATPDRMWQVTKRVFGAGVERLAIASPTPIAGGEPGLLAALDTAVAADASARLTRRTASIADLPKLGKPGTITGESRVPGLLASRLQLSNGVTVLVSDNEIEPDKVRVNVRFGNGFRGVAPTADSLIWTGQYAVIASGIGRFGQNEIDQMTNGRQIQLNFDIDDDAYEMSAESKPADLADQLRLMATKIAKPNWDPAPVERLKIGMLTGLEARDATPAAILDADLQGWLRGGDPRWTAPDRSAIMALTPAKFRAFWEPQLANGPIEVQIFGDLTGIDYRKVIARTFGALPARSGGAVADGGTLTGLGAANAPRAVYHNGDANQAAALIAWPTGGGLESIAEPRQLDVLAAVFNDRLFDKLRAELGASYSPIVQSQWPTAFPSGGYFLVGSMVAPADVDKFYAIAGAITADLVANPVSDDELVRARKPISEQITRASTGNVFWMYLLEGATRDPRVVRAALSLEDDTAGVSAGQVQALAQRYFTDDRKWQTTILPKPAGSPTTAAE
ncbi:MAG: hypothetical protein RLZZ58_1516 [Pseudomonadota bacterium]